MSEVFRPCALIPTYDIPRTLRAVVDPGGQTVSALDRIYLASGLPTLIIWGDEDPIIPIEHAYAAQGAIEGSRLEVMEGCGHFPHVEDPAQFVAILEDFIATTEPASTHTDDYRQILVAHSQGPAPAH